MSELHDTTARFCPHCGRPIVVAGAMFCKDCGATIGQTQVFTSSDPGMRSVAAFLLSVIPGLGHIYQHHPWRGILWFGAVAIGYPMGIGWILHLICAANAALYGRIREDVSTRRMRRRHRLNRASADFRM